MKATIWPWSSFAPVCFATTPASHPAPIAKIGVNRATNRPRFEPSVVTVSCWSAIAAYLLMIGAIGSAGRRPDTKRVRRREALHIASFHYLTDKDLTIFRRSLVLPAVNKLHRLENPSKLALCSAQSLVLPAVNKLHRLENPSKLALCSAQSLYPRWDSNPHCGPFKGLLSAIGVRGQGLHPAVWLGSQAGKSA